MFQIRRLPGAFYRKRCNAEGFKTEEWYARGDEITGLSSAQTAQISLRATPLAGPNTPL
jgi:hypothetical protein